MSERSCRSSVGATLGVKIWLKCKLRWWVLCLPNLDRLLQYRILQHFHASQKRCGRPEAADVLARLQMLRQSQGWGSDGEISEEEEEESQGTEPLDESDLELSESGECCRARTNRSEPGVCGSMEVIDCSGPSSSLFQMERMPQRSLGKASLDGAGSPRYGTLAVLGYRVYKPGSPPRARLATAASEI